jgi:hypothetical protein
MLVRGTCSLLLVLMFGFSSALPQTDSARLQYIKPFERQIFIGSVLKQRSFSFQLTNSQNRKNWVRYVPNNTYSAGARINLFGVGLEAAVAIPLATRNVERYGSTTVRELQGNSFTEKWFADFFWQRSNGFYVKRSWAPLTSKEIHPQRNDLDLRNTGLSFTYIFNHQKYSMRAPYQFSEHQRKNGGSVMLGFIMNRIRIESGDDIIDAADQSYFSIGADAESTDFFTAAIATGYGYTLVHKDFFLNVTALAGPSHHWMTFHNNQKHFDVDLNLYAAYQAALGYNGEHAFVGMTFSSRNTQVRMLETSVSSARNSFRLIAGFRLREKGFFTQRPKDLLLKLRAKK